MWHLAQAEFYAYIYAKTNNLNKINVSLMYFSQNKKDRLKKLYNYDFDILEQKIYRYLNDYLSYQKTFLIKESLRDESLKNLSFPFQENCSFTLAEESSRGYRRILYAYP